MKTAFLAKVASFSDDGDATLLAFADDPLEPVNYVMLDLPNQPDEQELQLGLDGVHIDTGTLDVEGYDLVHDIRETDAGIVVSLTPDAAQKAGIGQDIEIELESKIIDGISIGEAVRRFKDRLSSLERAKAQAPNDDPGQPDSYDVA
ncbi:hypothetical protein NDN01_23880 [Sphingomonas sp. QA11]|uniref:hypothetical protein n=1 Tax=Sphingomonas sp. QA11 TaxID=2950605 RepID=UPI00234A2D5A|nr:hypothetical protein [Sphingomonas sp. QA11]WCM26987.1 hypothetical protein NDN01_23880 [Sphingomonas sp. QA11]